VKSPENVENQDEKPVIGNEHSATENNNNVQDQENENEDEAVFEHVTKVELATSSNSKEEQSPLEHFEEPVKMRPKTSTFSNADTFPDQTTQAENMARDSNDTDEPVRLRKLSVPSISVITSEADQDAEDANKQMTEDTDNADNTVMEDIFTLKFDQSDVDLPHRDLETPSSIISLKRLLLEIGGTDLDGTFVRKSIDVNNLEHVQKLSNFIQTLNE